MKLFLKHNFWCEKRAHCIAYNNICTTIIVHIILFILGEIWIRRSNFASLLLIKVFAEVAKVNNEALNINPASLGKNIAKEKPRQNVFSYSYLGILFAMAKNAEIRGLYPQIIFLFGWGKQQSQQLFILQQIRRVYVYIYIYI